VADASQSMQRATGRNPTGSPARLLAGELSGRGSLHALARICHS